MRVHEWVGEVRGGNGWAEEGGVGGRGGSSTTVSSVSFLFKLS